MDSITAYQDGKNSYYVNSAFFSEITSAHFKKKYWKRKGAIVGKANGRNTAWFVRHGSHEMILRHYYRGGWVGSFIKKRFFYRSPLRSRAIREFQMLQHMREMGLPVPRPCAARRRSHGWSYRADILVERIPNSTDLADIMATQRALTDAEWTEVGRTIARFHQHNVFHSDLNCRNILLDADGKVWLIDFDKCRFRRSGPWKAKNLSRLLRSLNKENGRIAGFHWQPEQWQALLSGYASFTSP